MTWQDREAAPFAQEVWDQIDAVARAAADEVRAARRLVDVVGPLGFAARAGVAEDEPVAGEDAGREAHVHVPRVRALPVLHRSFSIGARSVAAKELLREPLVLSEAAEAARQIGRAEDRLLFSGNQAAGVRGLLAHEGALELAAGDWTDPPGRRTTSSARSPGSTRRDATARSRSPCRPAASTSCSGPTPGPRSRRTRSSCRRSREGS